jgi:hypothetical protein
LDQESDELLRYVTNLEEVNQGLVVNLLKRIATLEEINSQLATDLKSCVGLLKVFKEAVPNPKEWQNMLNPLNRTWKRWKQCRTKSCSTRPALSDCHE